MDITLLNLLKKGKLLFIGYIQESLPNIIEEYDPNRIKIFINKEKINSTNFTYKVDSLKNINLINNQCDIVFLDNKNALNIIKGLPFNALYVAISLRNPLIYPFLFIGIIRRIILRKYSFHKIKILRIKNGFTFWLFLKRKNPLNGYEFYLSKDIGIENFLNYLYKKNINYIVPRFFENLPKLKSPTSDLDLIVSEKDVITVKEFIISNAGDIRVDIWSTSAKDNRGITYLNKEILKGVLDRKIKGPCKSMIPSSKDYLNLLIYHSLYHKGYKSGIKSKLIQENIIFTNKYSQLIEKLALKNNLLVGNTMEEMHLYMSKEEWAPNKSEIKKLSKKNNWIKDFKNKM